MRKYVYEVQTWCDVVSRWEPLNGFDYARKSTLAEATKTKAFFEGLGGVGNYRIVPILFDEIGEIFHHPV